MGVSADRAEIQRKFIERFGLEFPMVPNPEKDIIQAWGVKKVLGVAAERTTFLVDPDGKIAAVWDKVKVEGHAEDVLRTLEKLVAERE